MMLTRSAKKQQLERVKYNIMTRSVTKKQMDLDNLEEAAKLLLFFTENATRDVNNIKEQKQYLRRSSRLVVRNNILNYMSEF